MFKNIKKNMKNLVDRNQLRLMDFKNKIFGNFKQEYFSQTGEDIIIKQIFKKKKNGVYVDVGAYHPKHYSNTHLLHKKGWIGINIDPNPQSIKFFQSQRPKDINLNYGISLIPKILSYHKFSHPSCNTFSEEQAEIQKNKEWLEYLGKDEVECKPLSHILDEHLKTEIDLLSIDVEGFDLEVLESNNWYKYAPEVIIIEGHGFDPDNPKNYDIYNFLNQKGYSLHGFTGLSLIFKKHHEN